MFKLLRRSQTANGINYIPVVCVWLVPDFAEDKNLESEWDQVSVEVADCK